MNRPNEQLETASAALRARLLAVARRRVAADTAEDVVQRAMTVILQHGGTNASVEPTAGVDGLPPLPWCLQVLRNTIGNLYQRQRTEQIVERGRSSEDTEASGPTPLQALESKEATRAIEEALDRLGESDLPCARYLRALADGTSPHLLAQREELSEPVLYRRVYRCRAKLRVILLEKGLLP